MLDTLILAEDSKDAKEGLLTNIVDDVSGEVAGPKLNKDELGEICDEMLLRGGVAGFKPLQVQVVESEQLQNGPRAQ